MNEVYVVMQVIESNEGFRFEELYTDTVFYSRVDARNFCEVQEGTNNLRVKTLYPAGSKYGF